jgi:hypothetical protein
MKPEDISELLTHLTVMEKVALAILAAKDVCREPEFLDWANAWLKGEDRNPLSAMAVIRKLPNGTVVATVDRPASLTRPKLSPYARAAATYAAQAAFGITAPGVTTDGLAREACKSAIAENGGIDLSALAELARKTC